MKVEATTDAAEFRTRVFPFLAHDVVRNTLLLSNIEARASGEITETAPAHYVSLHQDVGTICGVGMCTPGRGIVISQLAAEAAAAMAGAFTSLTPEAPSVHGPLTAAPLFAREWELLLGSRGNAADGQRLFELGTLVEPDIAGHARPARTDDLDLAHDWLVATTIAFGEPIMPSRESVASRIEFGRLWLWEHEGEPVSLACHMVTTFGATRIGPVYTPPEHRSHGYASGLTAHVSKILRDQGSRVCLFTDLANPTSNKIYQAIGYRPVGDFLVIDFR